MMPNVAKTVACQGAGILLWTWPQSCGSGRVWTQRVNQTAFSSPAENALIPPADSECSNQQKP